MEFVELNISAQAEDVYIDGINVGKAFNEVQYFVTNHVREGLLNYEEHVQHMLSLSSILLLTRTNYADFKSFPSSKVFQESRRRLGLMDGRFPGDTLLSMMNIFALMRDTWIERNDAII